jgi:hypothetical protein
LVLQVPKTLSSTEHGLTMGLFFTVLFAILLRGAAVSISIADRELFLSRLEAALPRIRYRVRDRSETGLVLTPKTLARAECLNVRVRIGPEAAAVVGPWSGVKRLKRLVERP